MYRGRKWIGLAMEDADAPKPIPDGPYDEPLDGAISLADLQEWVVTEGHRLTSTEAAEKAIHRRGVTDLPWFTALPEKKKISCGAGWAIEDADEAIRLTHINGRIRLRGISRRKPDGVRRIPRNALRNAVLDPLGGQPQKFGERAYGEIGQMRPGGFIHDTTWKEVCIDKCYVWEEWPFGRARPAAAVEVPSRELVTPPTHQPKSLEERRGGRLPIQRDRVIAVLREMFPRGVPRDDPRWTQENIRDAVVAKIPDVSPSTIKRAIKHLRGE
jgi:hypothetical protein